MLDPWWPRYFPPAGGKLDHRVLSPSLPSTDLVLELFSLRFPQGSLRYHFSTEGRILSRVRFLVPTFFRGPEIPFFVNPVGPRWIIPIGRWDQPLFDGCGFSRWPLFQNGLGSTCVLILPVLILPVLIPTTQPQQKNKLHYLYL